MELKHVPDVSACAGGGLLIVPYGIETHILICNPQILRLLIVPYGIETISM